jgi:hypothetical protein
LPWLGKSIRVASPDRSQPATASRYPQPGTPRQDDQPVEAIAGPGMGSAAHDRDDLVDRRQVSRIALI